MKTTGKIIKALFDIEPSALVTLFQIDLKEKGKYLFHAGENGYRKKIVFGGKEYDFFPIKAEGFETHGDGRLPRPKMAFANHQGVISLRLNYFEDFINYKVTRIKTFIKYLDDVNFPNNINPHAEPDPEATFSEDVFFINQKTQESDQLVEFELVSALELENANIPARKVYSGTCPWMYRSTIGCCYDGKPIADGKDKRFVADGYKGGDVGDEVYFPNSNGQQFGIGTPREWNSSYTYDEGDVVRLTPLNGNAETTPAGIYVCKNNGVKSNPRYDAENWVRDDCSRSIYGCRLRFSDYASDARRAPGGGPWSESQQGLPFGGFPGVDPYEYK